MASPKRSGNPAKRAAAVTEVTSAKQWKGKATETEPLELPSGNVALVRRPGMDKLLSMNLIPDSLTPIAQKAVDSAKGKPAELDEMDMGALMADPAKMADMFDSFDRILCYCVVQPFVTYHRRAIGVSEKTGKPTYEDIPFSDRDPELLYSDDVDLDDKLFIFQFVVGGTRDLERFRAEYASSMASVPAVEDLELPAK